MSEIVIRAEGLSKQFNIGVARQRHSTLRDSVGAVLGNTLKALRAKTSKQTQHNGHCKIWALKDVSFTIKRGEVVGIIGSNGAGKSTLLKIISRITDPTTGFMDVTGRVGSLLEVGTGFHPELTGRENVTLNGAIMGMKQEMIERKFTDIVSFSEIGKFIDTPVKHYSSGMYTRLAFAVAAHMEPEILLVDEVLAVGDLSFQRKCLNHLRNLTKRGATILLVSHNMTAIQTSCSRVIYLDQGQIVNEGKPVEIIETYRAAQAARDRQKETEASASENGGAAEKPEVSILGFEMFDSDGVSRREFKFGEPVRIKIELEAHRRIEHPMINFGIKRGDGVVICNFNNWYDNFKIDYIEGRCMLEGWLPSLRLVPDFYEIHVLVWPWGGGHLEGDMIGSRPFAATTFGDFQITGVGLNSHDGIIQLPAERWCFSRGAHITEFDEIDDESVRRAFAG